MAGSGRIFAVFDERTQDSGNISYGLEMDGRRYFVKTAGQPEIDASYYDHSKRINELRNAVGVAESSDHRALPKLIQVIESSTGPMLFYEWVEGDLVRSALDRIRQLPCNEVVDLLTEIYHLHVELAGRGWIAVDFYDSSLDREPFRGTEAQHRVMLRACEMAPADRFQSVAQMCEAWANAGQTGSNTNT